jgi:hypothetical protein
VRVMNFSGRVSRITTITLVSGVSAATAYLTYRHSRETVPKNDDSPAAGADAAPPEHGIEDETLPETLTSRLKQLTGRIAPTTLATAFLVYFGYVATRSRFEYFGVSLEMTDLSNQNLLLYGLEVVYVPAALTFLSVLTVIGIHAAVTWRLTTFPNSTANAFLAAIIGLIGLLLIGRALIGMLVPGTTDAEIPGTTPLALALGPAILAYGVWIFSANRQQTLIPRRLANSALACVIGLVIAGLFWAATEFAWAYGNGRGQEDADKISRRPEVVIDTKESLVGLPPGISQSTLPVAQREDHTFAYRYHGFRLLLSSGNRLFLVPGTWKYGTGQTVIVPYDNNIRIQLIPHS